MQEVPAKGISVSVVLPRSLILQSNPAADGYVTADPAGPYHDGDTVTLNAYSNSGYLFSNWSGDASGTNPSITVKMDSDKIITANFNVIRNLNISVNPAEGGQILNEHSGPYADGTHVTLTATPTPGYAFDQWSGDATGSNNPLIVTMDSDKSITANFLAVPLPYLSGLSRDSVAGGDSVTLSGMGFSAKGNKSCIYIGAKKVSVLSWSDTSITIKTPFRMPAAIYYIFVVTNNGQETNRLPLQVMAPEIDGVLPDYSLVHGSSSLSGKFLGPEAKVTLISVLSSRRHRARVVISDDSHILFIVPRVRKGAYKVIVSTPQGKVIQLILMLNNFAGSNPASRDIS